MNFVFDGVILAVVVLSIVLGAKRGFVKSVMGICTLLASVIVAYAFTPTVAAYIEQTPIITSISDGIATVVGSNSHRNPDGTYDLRTLFDVMPPSFREILDRYEADEEELDREVQPTTDSEEESVNALADLIAKPVARALSRIAAFLGILIVMVIVLKLLTWILDLIFQLPALKTANMILGLLVGIVTAFLWAWVLSVLSVGLIHAMSSIYPAMFSDSIIDNTIIVRFFSSGQFRIVLDWILNS